MIAPMKKVSLVIMDRERDTSLEKLRHIGLVHLEKRSVTSDVLNRLIERKLRVESAAAILRNFKRAERDSARKTVAADKDLVENVLSLAERRKSEQEALAAETREAARIAPWGNFEPASFAEFSQVGLVLIPYVLPRKTFEELEASVKVLSLSADKNSVRCLAIGAPLPGEDPFLLPEKSLADITVSIDAHHKNITEIESRLSELALMSDGILKESRRIMADIEFEVARSSLESTADRPEDVSVSWISGYIPDNEAGVLKRAAADQGWALLVDDVGEGDSPPTLVKNNSFVRLAQPIFDLLGTVPGYREYDISLSFLLFFTLFFAMIFGDGGYGLVLFGLAALMGVKSKKRSGKVSDLSLLLFLLSTATIVWGAVTGTWFALPMDALPGFLKSLIIPPLMPDLNIDPKDAARLVQRNIKHFCFIIGSLQLVMAHLKNIKKALPSLTAIAQLGWLVMMVGLYFLVLNLVLDKTAFPIPDFALYFIGGGLAAYFIFAEQKGGNFFINILKGIGNFLPTFLSAVSSFSDIISYIRLFAVGLAGFAIAESFNGMAGDIMSSIPGILAGLFILTFGHGLNVVMSLLSVAVHGIRLNMLEYSGHLGMEWSGVKYDPFALKNKSDV